MKKWPAQKQFLNLASKVILAFFAVLFCNSSFAQDSFLPERIPPEMRKPGVRAILEKWANSLEVSEPQHLFIEKMKYKNQDWLKVYFELTIGVDDVKDLTLEDLRSLSFLSVWALNQAGSEINVLFVPYIEIAMPNELKSFGVKKKNLPEDFKSMYANVLKPNDPYWKQSESLLDDGTGRAHAIFELGMTYINGKEPASLTHELNHLLFHNYDAYYDSTLSYNLLTEAESSKLDFTFNMKSGSVNTIHPLEVYAGLKRAGYLAPGWDRYIDRSEVFQIVGNNIFINSSSKDLVDRSMLFVTAYELNGKKAWEKRYIQTDRKVVIMDPAKNPAQLSDVPKSIDLGFLPAGIYLLETQLSESKDDSMEYLPGEWLDTANYYFSTRKILIQ